MNPRECVAIKKFLHNATIRTLSLSDRAAIFERKRGHSFDILIKLSATKGSSTVSKESRRNYSRKIPLQDNGMSRGSLLKLREILIKQESKNKIHIEERHSELSFRSPPLPRCHPRPPRAIPIAKYFEMYNRVGAEQTIQKRSK